MDKQFEGKGFGPSLEELQDGSQGRRELLGQVLSYLLPIGGAVALVWALGNGLLK